MTKIFPTNSLVPIIRHFFQELGTNKTYWLALSGGLDSCVLLHICLLLRDELNLTIKAIHVHHGLNAAADQWREHCQMLCKQMSVPLIDKTIAISLQPGESLEEAAREKRYAVFADYIDENSVLLTAHQQNDQAETFLLQLLRGAGLKGLAAMPLVKPFAKGLHARPLLNISRDTLLQYAERHALVWLEDASNQNTRFSRNYIRHHILKDLTQRWPSALKTLSRSARHCAEADILLNEFAEQVCQEVQGSDPATLSVSQLKKMTPSKQKLVLRAWIYQSGFRLPPQSKCETIVRDLLHARWDRVPFVEWDKLRLYRYRDNLYLRTLPVAWDRRQSYLWKLENPLQLAHGCYLTAKSLLGTGLKADVREVMVRFRQGGEKVTMPGRGRRTLKNLFQEWQILPWERENIPLIYLGEEIIAVAGYFYHAAYQASGEELGWEIAFLS